ncbi:IucA/IucC family protein [Bosea sp. 685]|uniref:IucA/IucC family protein n=1 Tax=Bosea sp. 685 TaxID=3080057 RepID=UPI002892B3D4|nr:IucA/IucC family protein [Bosea sp. 685]WNJ89611.1 IucA/IucC family protein [Bosea sp. 685]
MNSEHDNNEYIRRAKLESLSRILTCISDEELFRVEFSLCRDNVRFFELALPGLACVLTATLDLRDANKTICQIRLLSGGAIRLIDDPVDLIVALCDGFFVGVDTTIRERLINESRNNLANLTNSIKRFSDWADELSTELRLKNSTNLWDLIGQSDYWKAARFFEQWGSRGHPIHPFPKTKVGFTVEESTMYSPEYSSELPVTLLSIKREYVSVESLQSFGRCVDYMSENYEAWINRWKNDLTERGIDHRNYDAIPVHPWQLGNVISVLFADLIAKGDIIIGAGSAESFAPTLSFRTMMPVATSRPYIKLPVSVQATSVIRSLSHARAITGPRLSGIIQEVLSKDLALQRLIDFFPEELGVYLNGRGVTHIPDWNRNLSAIFRAPGSFMVNNAATFVVTAALTQASPGSGTPLFAEISLAYDRKTETGCLLLFKRYVDILIYSLLTMYMKYGIAWEGHQQNTGFLFDHHGKLARLALRDCSGLRIFGPDLEARGIKFEGVDGSDSAICDRGIVRAQLLHTLYRQNLGEIVNCLHLFIGIPKADLWKIAAFTTYKVIFLNKDTFLGDYKEEIEHFLYRDWSSKAFLSMRFREKGYLDIESRHPNPMRSFYEELKDLSPAEMTHELET